MDHLTWKKSSRSGPNGGECVEVAVGKSSIYVRDSKDPNGPKIALSGQAWARFIIRIIN